MLEGSSTPVRRARVNLTGAELRGGRSVITDEQGRFGFQALPAGRFTMTATKAGFVDMPYGAKRAGRPGTPIQLGDGQKLEKAVITMPRGSVITGVVVDENGEPSPGTQVRAMRYVIRTGEKTLQQSGQDQTDDRGIYRIYQLQPGEYIVSAVPRNMSIGDMRASIAGEVASLMQQAQSLGGAAGGNFAGARPGGPGQALLARAAELQQQLQTTDQEQSTAYAPVYYPGTTTLGTAVSVNLGAGEERSGVDFRLELVATATLGGMVTSADGTLPPNVQVSLLPADRTGMPGMPGFGPTTSRPDASGNFTFRNITPGQYTLQARANIMKPAANAPQRGTGPGPAGGGRGGVPMQVAQVLWASTEVTVSGQNQSGLALMLQPGMTVSGRVDFDGMGAPPTDLARVRVSLTSRGSQGMEMGGVPPAEVDGSGRFTINGVPPGRYVFSASAPTGAQAGRGAGPVPTPALSGNAAWTLKSVSISGTDALDFPLEVGPNVNVSDAVVTFTDRQQELSGMIQDSSGRPTADFTIIVFPTDRRYWLPLSRRITSTRPGTDGKFSIRSLPAGDYRLTAVTDVEPGEWYDPNFLAQLMNASISFSLNAGEKKVQDIRLAGGN